MLGDPRGLKLRPRKSTGCCAGNCDVPAVRACGGRPSLRPAVRGRRRAGRNCPLPGQGKHRRMRAGRAGEHPGRCTGRGWQGGARGQARSRPWGGSDRKPLGVGVGWGSRTCPVTGVSGVGLELLAETLLLHDFFVLGVKALGSTRSKSLSGKMDLKKSLHEDIQSCLRWSCQENETAQNDFKKEERKP